jgi:hypothetical protein
LGIRESIVELVTAFNRGSLDVPAGFLTPHAMFTLNNRSYEAILGGSPDDPLIRLLTRGAGGYRAVARTLQYALKQPRITIESLSESDAEGGWLASLRVDGQLRDSDGQFSFRCSMGLSCTDTALVMASVQCREVDLERIASARR